MLSRHLAPRLTNVGHTATGLEARKGLSDRAASDRTNEELRLDIVKQCSVIFVIVETASIPSDSATEV